MVTIALMRTHLPPRRVGPIVSLGDHKNSAFTMFWICESVIVDFLGRYLTSRLSCHLAVMFTFAGLYIISFHIESYALNLGIQRDLTFYTLIIMNAAGVPKLLLPPFVADRYVPDTDILSFGSADFQGFATSLSWLLPLLCRQ